MEVENQLYMSPPPMGKNPKSMKNRNGQKSKVCKIEKKCNSARAKNCMEIRAPGNTNDQEIDWTWILISIRHTV